MPARGRQRRDAERSPIPWWLVENVPLEDRGRQRREVENSPTPPWFDRGLQRREAERSPTPPWLVEDVPLEDQSRQRRVAEHRFHSRSPAITQPRLRRGGIERGQGYASSHSRERDSLREYQTVGSPWSHGPRHRNDRRRSARRRDRPSSRRLELRAEVHREVTAATPKCLGRPRPNRKQEWSPSGSSTPPLGEWSPSGSSTPPLARRGRGRSTTPPLPRRVREDASSGSSRPPLLRRRREDPASSSAAASASLPLVAAIAEACRYQGNVRRWKKVAHAHKRYPGIRPDPDFDVELFKVELSRWLEIRGLHLLLSFHVARPGALDYIYTPRQRIITALDTWEKACHGTWWYALSSILHTGIILESSEKAAGHDFHMPGTYVTWYENVAKFYCKPQQLFGGWSRVMLLVACDTAQLVPGKKRRQQRQFPSGSVAILGVRFYYNDPPEAGLGRLPHWDPSLEARPP